MTKSGISKIIKERVDSALRGEGIKIAMPRETPWLVDEANDWLEENITEDTRVLEYGSGCSSVWFAKRTKHFTTVENHAGWAMAVTQITGMPVILCKRPYDKAVTSTVTGGEYDFILVDGRDRVLCATQAVEMLVPGGVLMLDDSERVKYDPIRELTSTWELIACVLHPADEELQIRAKETTWWRKPKP